MKNFWLGVFYVSMIMIIIIVNYADRKRKVILENYRKSRKERSDLKEGNISPEESEIERKVKFKDFDFSRENFLELAKKLFLKFESAWSNREISTLESFETPDLFEIHKAKIQSFIDNNLINKKENVIINWAKLSNFRQFENSEILDVILNSKMNDYVVDERSGNVVSGNKDEAKSHAYVLVFRRKIGERSLKNETIEESKWRLSGIGLYKGNV